MTQKIKAIVFDAYGTLFDVYSVSALAEEMFPGAGAAIARTWREKQIEYTWLRTMCDRHADFWQVTAEALDYACAAHKVDLSADQRAQLMQHYNQLVAYPENAGVLGQLKQAGMPLAILSNGTPAMIHQVAEYAGIASFFDHLLSVEAVGKFKTAPEVYQLGPDTFGVSASEILFVSSNGWDIGGATWFGYQTLWINRHNLPVEQLGVAPHHIGASLADVTRVVSALNP